MPSDCQRLGLMPAVENVDMHNEHIGFMAPG